MQPRLGPRQVGYLVHRAMISVLTAGCRHLYALYCMHQRQMTGNLDPSPDDPIPSNGAQKSLPAIFADPGWNLLNTSILSTSNCGNPALRLFGFGPVAADGYGIGYIIKENGISV